MNKRLLALSRLESLTLHGCFAHKEARLYMNSRQDSVMTVELDNQLYSVPRGTTAFSPGAGRYLMYEVFA